MPKSLLDSAEVIDLITVPATARRIGVHTETLYRLIRAGDFPPAVHIGHQVRISVPRLERFLHGEGGIVSARVSGAVPG